MFVEKPRGNGNVIELRPMSAAKACRHIGFFDSSQRVEMLVTMYRKGYSSRQIAQAFGTTKNTVLGKITRLRASGLLEDLPPPVTRIDWTADLIRQLRALHSDGLTRKEAAGRMNCLESQVVGISKRIKLLWGRWRKTPAYRQPPPKRRKPIEVVAPVGVPLLDATNHHCRWPIDTTDGSHVCCGHETVVTPSGGRKSYCEYHCSVSYRRTDTDTETE